MIANSTDYESIMTTMDFDVDDGDGEMRCLNVTINEDDFVECDEDFTVELSLVTIGAAIALDNSTTVINILDDDCEY